MLPVSNLLYPGFDNHINGEVIEIPPQHPFYTLYGGWLDTEDLYEGTQVRSFDGELRHG